MKIQAQVTKEQATQAEDLGWRVVLAPSALPPTGWVIEREIPDDSTEDEIQDYREAIVGH